MEFLQDPAFWAAVAFVIFIAATAKPISRLLTAGLDKRADKIRSDLEEAEKLREEAQDLLASYQRKQRDALAEAEAIIAHAGEEAERLAVQERDKLEETLGSPAKMKKLIAKELKEDADNFGDDRRSPSKMVSCEVNKGAGDTLN